MLLDTNKRTRKGNPAERYSSSPNSTAVDCSKLQQNFNRKKTRIFFVLGVTKNVLNSTFLRIAH